MGKFIGEFSLEDCIVLVKYRDKIMHDGFHLADKVWEKANKVLETFSDNETEWNRKDTKSFDKNELKNSGKRPKEFRKKQVRKWHEKT